MTIEQDSASKRRAVRKPYPVMSFERALELPTAIHTLGVSNVRRLTLFQELNRSPNSSLSRQLLSTSAKYGLTSGNYNDEYIELTNEGMRLAIAGANINHETLQLQFSLSIRNFPIFNEVYEQLKNKRIPVSGILKDMMEEHGATSDDTEEASKVFLENIHYIGLVQAQAGGDFIIPLEQLLEDTLVNEEEHKVTASTEEIQKPVVETPSLDLPSVPRIEPPGLHIDVQIHIDATASPEQIDKIFSSMGRYLYGREG